MNRTYSALAFVSAFALFGTISGKAEFAIDGEGSLSGDYLAARTADRANDLDAAADYLSKALLRDPQNTALTEQLFLLELASGDIPSAQELARKVVQFNSQERMARLTLGLQELEKRHYNTARHHFTEAAYTPIGQLTSALLTAWSYAGAGDQQKALAALDKINKAEAFANFKLYHSALVSDFMKNPVRAEASYKEALAKNPRGVRIVQAYGNFLRRHGRPDDAKKIYESYASGGQGSFIIDTELNDLKTGKTPPPFIGSAGGGAAEALFSLASIMTDDQSLDVALMYVQLALALPGDKPIEQTLLGDILSDQKRYEAANAIYASVPAASPLWVNAQMNIAVNLQRLDKSSEAISILKGLVARNPQNGDAWSLLGTVYRVTDKLQEAADAYTQALGIGDPNSVDQWRNYYHRGISYQQLGKWDKAEPDFRTALKLSPSEPLILNYLGYSMIEKKINLQEALDMVKKAVELKSNDGMIVDSLAWAYYQLGDYDKALIESERAVELVPADPVISEHLGDIYWKVGRKLEAYFQWQHAKDNDPEPADLQRIEDKLKNGMPDDAPAPKPKLESNKQSN